MKNSVKIDYPLEDDLVITSPRLPGLRVELPKGAMVTNRLGGPVKRISLTPIPTERMPYPMPAGVHFPVYFTLQPGGATVYTPGVNDCDYSKTECAFGPGGARVIYPNSTKAPAGTRGEFWNYDARAGWRLYGGGSVSPDGRSVVPDANVSIHKLGGASAYLPATPAPDAGPNGVTEDGDPVDLATGLFVYEKNDLALPGNMPISLTRIYRPQDSVPRAFGIGSTHPYEIYLKKFDDNYSAMELIQADGSRVKFERMAGTGTDPTSGIWIANSTHTSFYKSYLIWDGKRYEIHRPDGSMLGFAKGMGLTEVRDRFGNGLSLLRLAGNRVGTVRSTSGRWISFTYDAEFRVTRAEDNIGRHVDYAYDAQGRLATVTDVKGGVTTYTYDTSHRMLTIEDTRDIVFLTNEYDASGRVVEQTQADSTTYEFDYTVTDNKITRTEVTDPRGFVRQVNYDSDGYPTSDIAALGTSEEDTTTYEWWATRHLKSVTDDRGRKTFYEYDEAPSGPPTKGNLTKVTRLHGTAQATSVSYTYEPRYQQVASITNELNKTTTFTYANNGLLERVTDPEGRDTNFTFWASGQVKTIADELSHTTTLSYSRGDLVSSTDPTNKTTTTFLDGAGRRRLVTDPLGNVTTYAFDAANLVSSVNDALGTTTAFQYDPNGNLTKVIDARLKETSYVYNSMDRVQSRTDPRNKTETFAYDNSGNLKTHTDRESQVTTFRYDGLGRRTFTGFDTGGTEQSPTYESTIDVIFDDANDEVEIDDSETGVITQAYDPLGQLSSEISPRGTVSYIYRADGSRQSMTIGSQTTSYGYDDSGLIESITRGSEQVAFAYDLAGRRDTTTLGNGVVSDYTLDDAGRITAIAYKDGPDTLGDLAYDYDAAGRRTQVSGSFARIDLPQTVTATTYDDANRLTNWAGTAMTYDDNGNLTDDGPTSYDWNARGELTSMTGPTDASFAYDGLGRRTRATVEGDVTKFLHDGDNVVQELNNAGAVTATLLTGLGIDEVFSRTQDTTTSHFLTDALGSTIALTDANGAVATEYAYESFGKARTIGAANNNRFQFTARDNDGTGLQFNRARYYSPTMQRFISEDPIGFAGGDVNLFAFVRNAPSMFADPTGNSPTDTQTLVTREEIDEALDQVGDGFTEIYHWQGWDEVAFLANEVATWTAILGCIATTAGLACAGFAFGSFLSNAGQRAALGNLTARKAAILAFQSAVFLLGGIGGANMTGIDRVIFQIHANAPSVFCAAACRRP